MLNWRKRIPQWVEALRRARSQGKTPWLGMLRMIARGPVDRKIWRARMRTCLRCPVYDRVNKICGPDLPRFQHVGCRCYAPFVALAPSPYNQGDYRGCWGWATSFGELGWMGGEWPTRWLRLKAFLYFTLNIQH